MRRVLSSMVAVVLVVAMLSTVGLGIGGWYYSDQLLAAAPPEAPDYDVRIADVLPTPRTAAGASVGPAGVGTRTAELVFDITEGDLAELATVGLRTEDGLVVLDGEPEVGSGSTSRTGTLIEGVWPQPGDLAAAAIDTYADDPAVTLGLLCDRVDVPSRLGPLPAWRSVPPGADEDAPWVVLVHGRGAGKEQTNRALATAYALGLPSLVIALRNDPGAPASVDGYGHYGATEWEDLEAAIDHLRGAQQADEFVLVGYSQGASVVLSFLRRSPDASLVDRAALVSPLISLNETLELQARKRDIPELLIPPLLTATRWISGLRSGLDFSQVEHLERIDELPRDVEFLVTHGDDDHTVPVGPSRAFADALPGQVEYHEYAGVGHVREWNADRERFESDLREFLSEAATGTSTVAPTPAASVRPAA